MTSDAASSKTILIVEDDFMLRESLCMFFEHFAYTVLRAANGAEALDIYSEHAAAIQVVITDVAMPEMNGLELCRRLRQLKSTVQIVIVSGYTTTITIEELTALKVSAFLAKPVATQRLYQLVEQLIKEPVEGFSLERTGIIQSDNPKPY
jgi:two-component system, cell cycle sensor histidine kinase and response regulator CckA